MTNNSTELNRVERVARQCVIYVEEVYDETGRKIVGTKAQAILGNRLLCDLTVERVDSPQKLGELLGGLGVMIGNAIAPEQAK